MEKKKVRSPLRNKWRLHELKCLGLIPLIKQSDLFTMITFLFITMITRSEIQQWFLQPIRAKQSCSFTWECQDFKYLITNKYQWTTKEWHPMRYISSKSLIIKSTSKKKDHCEVKFFETKTKYSCGLRFYILQPFSKPHLLWYSANNAKARRSFKELMVLYS